MDRNEIIRFFRLHKEDSESICVEIGFLSNNILALEQRLRTLEEEDPIFFASRLDLLQKTRSRRKLLDILKSTNMELYNQVTSKIKRFENYVDLSHPTIISTSSK